MDKENVNIDKQQLMTYYRQGIAGGTSVLPSLVEVPKAKELTLDDKSHALVDFLERPFDVYKGEWKTDTTPGSELLTAGISLPDVLFENPMLKEKLRGFVGIRGTVRARIMINAQKFQQGILLLYWIPNYDNIATKAKMVQQSLAGKSGCAHVTINCEGGTEQTIDIPYVNQHIYYNATTNQGSYGRLFITPLLQLRSASASSVGVRIQMWMENPQPEFATSAVPVLSQSVSQIESKRMHKEDALPQESTSGGLDVKTLWNAIKSASPMPSYLAQTTANALQLMGLQKPTQQASITRASLRTNSYMANFNGEYMGHKLSLAANNELEDMLAPAGTSCDEMAISTLVKAPTYYKSFTVKPKSSDGYGENYIVWSDLIHPMKFTPAVGQAAGVLDSTFLGYTASAFGQWRGGIKFNFSVAKTCFHSGTLRVTFIPGVYKEPTGVPNAYDPAANDYKPEYQFERCYQRTYDLRDMNEFAFVVPYVASRPYLNNINPYGAAAKLTSKKNWATGILVVDIFIPVVSPASVHPSFDVAVWVSGDEDLTFANPTAPSIYPYSPPTFVSSQSFSLDEGSDRAQAILASNENLNHSRPKTSFHPSALCTGEVVASIKALCGRFGPFYAPGSVSLDKILQIAPFDFQDPVAGLNVTVTFDYLDYFSYLYAFYRGGVRLSLDPGAGTTEADYVWRVIMRSALNVLYPIGTIPRGTTIALGDTSEQFLRSPFASILSKPSIEGVVDVEVPYYNLTHITPALTAKQTRSMVEESNYPFPILSFVPRRNSTDPTTVTRAPLFFRACSDDFRFLYMIGPPQVLILQDSATVIPSQFANMGYTTQNIINDGSGDFAGAFGFSTFKVGSKAPGNFFRPPTQFVAVNQTTSSLWLMPSNLAYGFWNNVADTVLNVNATYWKGGNSCQLLAQTPNFAFSNTSQSPSLFTTMKVIAPIKTALPQAQPTPCVTFTSEVSSISVNSISITFAGWNLPITFGTETVLEKRLLVFTGTSSAANQLATASYLDAGYSVTFTLESIPSTTNRQIKVSKGATVLGYIATTLRANIGFPVGTPVPALTAATPINTR